MEGIDKEVTMKKFNSFYGIVSIGAICLLTMGCPTSSKPGAPSISSVDPATVTNDVNTVITINGSGFLNGLTAEIGNQGLIVNSVSSSQVKATVIAGVPAAIYDVSVTNIDGQKATLSQALTVNNPTTPPPDIVSINPISATNYETTTLVIYGSNFRSGATVSVGATSITVNTVSSNTIVTTVGPGLAAGTYNVTVQNPDSQSDTLSNAFTVISYPAPTVSSVYPTAGPSNAETPILISGAGFVEGATASLDSNPLRGVVVNGTTLISAFVPDGIVPGSYQVTVTNPDGQSATCACTFVVYQGPRITSLSPSSGKTGTLFTITGTLFGSSQGSSTVTVNGVDASVSSWSDTQIVAYIPGEASCGPVIVTVLGIPSNPVNFNITPQISLLAPSTASVNNRMAIIGSGFNNSPAMDQVLFNGVAPSIISLSSTYILTNQPIASVGISVTVQVTNLACNLASNVVTFTTVAPGTVSPYLAGFYGLWDIYNLPEGNGGYATSRSNNSVLKGVSNDPMDPTNISFLTMNISPLNQPTGIVLDSSENVFVTNYGSANLVKAIIDPNTGLASSSAVFATGFNRPEGLAIDKNDTMYIANSGANTVSRITAGGTVTASWGTGLSLPRGLTIDGIDGKFLWVTNRGGNTVSKIDLNTGGAPVISYSGFNSPSGIAFSQEECVYYVTNNSANTISRLYPSGGHSIYADSGQGLDQPVGLEAGGDGELIVANYSTALSPSGNAIEILQRNTPSYTNIGVTFTCPMDMDYDSRGNLFVASQDGCGGAWDVTMVPPTGPARGLNITGVTNAVGIVADDANPPNIYISTGSGTVVKYTLWGSASNYSTGYLCLWGMDLDPAGNLYVMDNCTGGIYKVPPGGGAGNLVTTLMCPIGAAFNKVDGFLYVEDWGLGCGGPSALYKVNPNTGASSNIANISSLLVSSDECGNVWTGTYRVTPDGRVMNYLQGSPCFPYKVAFSTTTTGGFNTGGMYELDVCSQVMKVNVSASFMTYMRGPVDNPQGITFNPTSGDLYVANDRSPICCPPYSSVTKAGTIYPLASTFTSTPMIWSPRGLEFDYQGNLYVADIFNFQIEKVWPSGITNIFVPCCNVQYPWGLSFNGGVFDLFVGGMQCCWQHQIFRVDSSSNVFYDANFPGNFYTSYLDFDPGGNLYIGLVDGGGNDIYRRLPGGATSPFIAGTGNVQGVAVSPTGTGLYWARPTTAGPPNYQISRAPLPAGSPVSVFATGLNNPQGIAFDPLTYGLFVANQGNNTISRIAP